jgi:hypothetical protein
MVFAAGKRRNRFYFRRDTKYRKLGRKKSISGHIKQNMRSCRATTHADLATLKEPVVSPYYCKKHGKICKPLLTIKDWWKTYAEDTIKGLKSFKVKNEYFSIMFVRDSRNFDIYAEVNKKMFFFTKY